MPPIHPPYPPELECSYQENMRWERKVQYETFLYRAYGHCKLSMGMDAFGAHITSKTCARL